MTVSLLLMTSATTLALLGVRRSIAMATIGTLLASLGTAAGFVLMISSPVLSQCILLTAYLASAVALYAFGFGWGAESRAKLLKVR